MSKKWFCKENESDCLMYKNYYPRSTPIKCDDGGYAISIKSCQKLSSMIKCSPNEFYCTAQCKCVSSQNLCI
jgi:hypothetical protein